MKATNQVSSPITISKRTTLFLWLVNGSCQSPFPFNYPTNLDRQTIPPLIG